MAIKTLSNQLRRYMSGINQKIGERKEEEIRITDIQGRIISYLYEGRNNGDIYQKDIEKHFNIRRSTATNILKRIEKNGLIHRKKCVSDARMKVLVLREKARQICPETREAIQRAERQAVKGLTDAELAVFFKVVKTIVKNIT